MNNLTQKKCTPCQGGVPPITGDDLRPWLEQIDPAWKVIENDKKITRTFELSSFMETITLVNEIAKLAETEGHHPDLHIFFKTLTIELWTHKIDGLYDNDFILAAKIDELYKNHKTASK